MAQRLGISGLQLSVKAAILNTDKHRLSTLLIRGMLVNVRFLLMSTATSMLTDFLQPATTSLPDISSTKGKKVLLSVPYSFLPCKFSNMYYKELGF